MPEDTSLHTEAPSQLPAVTSSPKKPPIKPILLTLGTILLIGVIAYFAIPHKDSAAGGDRRKGPRTAPVSVAKAVLQSVPIEIRTTGNIVPYSLVNIVPQVSGQITQVCFKQGQDVHKGDVLFLIDSRTYRAMLAQAQGNVQKDLANIASAEANTGRDQANIGQMKANLKKDQANLKYAEAESDRYKKLVVEGAISQEQADQTATSFATATAQIEADKKQIQNAEAVVKSDRAQIETAKATLQADQALVDNAQIQLDWCTIRAPIDGRTGSLQVYAGNVVTANTATPMVTIAQVHPIYVQFTIPEEYLDQVRRCLENKTLRIQAMLEGVATDFVMGTATFLENTVNTTSGTALLRAEFENTDNRLYPGQFTDVSVTMPPQGASVVVPISAIQTTQRGNAVYVVKDGKADLAKVELARTTDEWAAISEGIQAGDTVVTDGQLQLTPGASVKIVPAGQVDGGGGNAGGGRKHRHHADGGTSIPSANPGAAATPVGGSVGGAPGDQHIRTGTSWGDQTQPSNSSFHALDGAQHTQQMPNGGGWHHSH